MFENVIIQVKELISSVIYCFKLSWQVSKFNFFVRLFGKIIIPINIVLISIILKDIINILEQSRLDNSYDYTRIFILIVISSLIRIINTVLNSLIEYASDIHTNNIEKYINMEIIENGTSSDLELFDNTEKYNKMVTAQRDYYAITVILWNVIDCLSAIISLIVIMLLIIKHNYLYGTAMLIACVPSGLSRQKYTKLLYKLGLTQIKNERQKQYVVQIATSKAYAQDVRFYNMGDMLKDKYSKLWKINFYERRITLKRRTLFSCILSLLPEFIMMIIGINIASDIVKGKGTIGDYSLYIGFLTQLWSCTVSMITSFTKVYEDRLKIDNFNEFKKIPKKIVDLGKNELTVIKKIEFKKVCFRYPFGEHNIINNMSFIINEGEKVAIVGINGAGKSTLIKLLLRFYDVSEGAIEINGIDIRFYSIQSLRKCFALYFQQTINYGFSLRENITLSSRTSKEDEKNIMNAIYISDSEKILSKTKNGLDTHLTKIFEEDGIELSIGQNQKIALARTFYRNAPFLILDEPSSDLDPEAEYHIFQAFDKVSVGKTILYTSHRLSNIAFANRIIVIENGCVVEDGTKEELLNNPKRFADLYKYYLNEC